MNRTYLGIIIALIALVAATLLIVNAAGTDDGNPPTPNPSPSTPIPTPTLNESSPSASVPEDWLTYSSELHRFTVSYPPEMEVEINDNNIVRFLLLGPTQTEGTEFYDGILFTFDSGELENQSLLEFVEDQHRESLNEPAVEDVSEIKPVTYAEIEGYEYEVTGLGESTLIYLPNSPDRYLFITRLVEDPENRGFEETADTFLSSLVLTAN